MTHIIKASGEKERFNGKQIVETLLKAGASRKFANEVVGELKGQLYDGISSKEILKRILKLLEENPEVWARYDLKRAIMSLGPSGFPFEEYFAQILQNYGYKTEVGTVMSGKKITHEVDIVAHKVKRYMIECKYRNRVGAHVKSKSALYTHARFLDLKENFDFSWLATNTHCSPDVMEYAKSVNMKITSWKYPAGESLQELIMKKGLYPITILKSVKGDDKIKLYNAKVMLAKDLTGQNLKNLSNKTGLSNSVLRGIIDEANKVVGLYVGGGKR